MFIWCRPRNVDVLIPGMFAVNRDCLGGLLGFRSRTINEEKAAHTTSTCDRFSTTLSCAFLFDS